ncbi:SIMPL domain-containing protein [Desulfonatronovibrio hydrogenovorans]|uniref:SIMPL domain-containing protein n=1 Tax=Desulfonatronovibrio hydrogenovorans TaxID=53245 RepID=UPI00048BD34D|nr:SIMPL domain-containing protein [Desulfonatronovibrio hydrogenovorans]
MADRASNNFMAGVILALALVAGAWILGSAIKDFRAYDRFVSVRGFAEREVQADLAYWPISFSAAGNDLQKIQQELDTSRDEVLDFLARQGLGQAEISVSAPRITDQHAYGVSEQHRPANRFTAQSVITVRTDQADLVKQAMAAAGELVTRGVVLIHSYEFQPRFEFTGLAEIKPEMIAQATKDARNAAQQFAHDSDSRVGAIRRASQGLFTINDRDPFTPEIKLVRVVTSVDYFLKD